VEFDRYIARPKRLTQAESACGSFSSCPNASWAVTLWVVTAILLILLLATIYLTWRARQPGAKERRQETYRDAISQLESLAPHKRLAAGWTALVKAKSPDRQPSTPQTLLLLLYNAGPDAIADLRSISAPNIRQINEFARLVDEGLLSLKDLAADHSVLHRELLFQVALLSPIIWYESLIAGLGRIGYRVLQLGPILGWLRCYSDSGTISDELVVQIAGHDLLVCDEQTRVHRLVYRSIGLLWRPTITTRRKVRQNQEASDLLEHLHAAGVEAVDLFGVPSAVAW